MLALHNRWSHGSSVVRHSYAGLDFMRGHVVGISVQPPGEAVLTLIGVYMPFAKDHREAIYAAIASTCEHSDLSITADDWNATLLQGDRCSSGGAIDGHLDLQHADFVKSCHLRHLQWSGSSRAHTFRSHADLLCSSRIDDILVSDRVVDTAKPEWVAETSDDSDHAPLLGSFGLSRLGLTCPPPWTRTPKESRLKTPVNNAQLHKFKETLEVRAAVEIYASLSTTTLLVQQATAINKAQSSLTCTASMLEASGVTKAAVLGAATTLKELLTTTVMDHPAMLLTSAWTSLTLKVCRQNHTGSAQ